jgi:hypothetical protein
MQKDCGVLKVILSFNARDAHPRDKAVIDWYKGLYKSERSRKIIEVLYAHIIGNQHTTDYESGEIPKEKKNDLKIEMVDVTGDDELDLDSKLDLFGGRLL